MDYDLYIKNGKIVSHTEIIKNDIAIKDGKIVFIGLGGEKRSKKVIDAMGMHLLPGLIDGQVHFREPGSIHKEDLETGSRGAVLGGVTTFFEMPNTDPPTLDLSSLQNKIDLGYQKSYANFAFFLGASRNNLDSIRSIAPMEGLAGIKIFLGSSTGPLLLTDEKVIQDIFNYAPGIIAIHSENEKRLRDNIHLKNRGTSVHQHPLWRDVESAFSSTRQVIEWAKKAQRKVHILHISSREEIEFLQDQKEYCTIEVTPQHLTLHAETCYDRLGTYAQMNPPIRGEVHREALWRALEGRTIDVIGSDHAPHTREEKDRGYPHSPSGLPGVQTTLHLMLEHVFNKRLSLTDLVRLLCFHPAKLYDLDQKGVIAVGRDADLVLIDLAKVHRLEDRLIASRCAYTPFAGMTIHGEIVKTILGGKVIVEDGKIVVDHPTGRPVKVRGPSL